MDEKDNTCITPREFEADIRLIRDRIASIESGRKEFREEYRAAIKTLHERMDKEAAERGAWQKEHGVDSDRRLEKVEQDIRDSTHEVKETIRRKNANTKKQVTSIVSAGASALGAIAYILYDKMDRMNNLEIEMATKMTLLEGEVANLLCQVYQYGC